MTVNHRPNVKVERGKVMGYGFSELTLDSLISFIEAEYDYIRWDKESLENEEDHIAIWGWDQDGLYSVALGLKLCQKSAEARGYDWHVKVINEIEGPVIQPTEEFLKRRPPMNLRGKISLEEAETEMKTLEEIQEFNEEHEYKGIIQSAVKCGNGLTFIWTTTGNYYIPSSVYDANRAMAGLQTIESLKRAYVFIKPTKEEQPNT